MSFRITGLPAEEFASLFALSPEELAARGALRVVADCQPGYPCRVSLTDAAPGDEIILVHYEHHRVDSPYRASHAVYVRAGETRYDEVDRIPAQLRSRTLSVRAFDERGLLVGADLTEGTALEGIITQRFADPRAAYIHVHYAKPGCYAARVERS